MHSADSRTIGSSIFEVLEMGLVGAGSEELGYLITINGAYLNFWGSRGEGRWENTDCRYCHKDLYQKTAAEAWDECKKWAKEIETGTEEEESY